MGPLLHDAGQETKAAISHSITAQVFLGNSHPIHLIEADDRLLRQSAIPTFNFGQTATIRRPRLKLLPVTPPPKP
jgi:hypothetical protein